MSEAHSKLAPSVIRGANHALDGLFLAIYLILWTPQLAYAQEYMAAAVSRHVLTNEGVVALAKAGFDEYFIVERIPLPAPGSTRAFRG